ncbi:hypothetical protein VTL71DRAFT_1022 [Oculimacula yallundae]|uniref:Uncharacterized protein n=1 Tax=Oculimacula yallundae TaxID=86028 RepID=A0ABR4D1W5_9HELO
MRMRCIIKRHTLFFMLPSDWAPRSDGLGMAWTTGQSALAARIGLSASLKSCLPAVQVYALSSGILNSRPRDDTDKLKLTKLSPVTTSIRRKNNVRPCPTIEDGWWGYLPYLAPTVGKVLLAGRPTTVLAPTFDSPADSAPQNSTTRSDVVDSQSASVDNLKCYSCRRLYFLFSCSL